MLSLQQRKKHIQKITKDKRLIAILAKYPREIFTYDQKVKELYEPSKLKFKGAWGLPDIEYVIEVLKLLLDLKNKQKVLIIGTGTGYMLTILSQVFEECYGVEIDKNIYEDCMENLTVLKINNAVAKLGDGYLGWDADEKFDCIVFDCGIDVIRGNILQQLDEEGIIIAPIGELNIWPEEGFQNLTVIRKSGDKVNETIIDKVFVTPIIGGIEKLKVND